MNYRTALGIDGVQGIRAGFTTRAGGVSHAPYASLNLSISSGDDREAVLENRRILANAVGFSAEQMVIGGLVHGADVMIVDTPGLAEDVDGIVSNKRGLLLCVTAADCAVVLLADPDAHVIGACHAGWRGAVAGVATNSVSAMVGLGADVSRIRAFISPCISQNSFEVGSEVARQFAAEFVTRNSATGKQHVDLRGAIASELATAGVETESISVSPDCTYRDTTTYFSYRAENGKTGRMMGFIGSTDALRA